jgi:hypothetical protein
MSEYTPTGKPFRKPLKFKTVEELQQAIENYFYSLYTVHYDQFGNPVKDKFYKEPAEGEPADTNPFAGYVVKKVKVATVTGLAVYLDTSRETLLDYEHGKYDGRDAEGNQTTLTPEQQEWNDQQAKYSDTIKRAKQMILDDTEQQLFQPGRSTGAIFSLKVNYMWQDKTVTELHDPDGVLDPFAGLSTDELRKLAKGQ